jgi:hypothetical protein
MSGEAVVLVGVSAGAAGVAAAAGVAYLAARMVAEWLREQHAMAERDLRQEKERSTAWQAFHRSEQQTIEKLTRHREALRNSLKSLRLEPAGGSSGGQTGTTRRGFVEPVEGQMNDLLDGLLERLSPQVPAGALASLQRLEQQARELDRQQLSSSPPPDRTLRSFRTTLQRTAEQNLQDLQREADTRRRRLARLEAVLEQTIAYQRLAREPTSGQELLALREQLFRLLTTGQVSASGVELLERQLARLKDRVDRELEQSATQAVLDRRVRELLVEMGYRPASAPDGPNEWHIPGGERVRMALHRDNRLAFQLEHEGTGAADRPIDAQQLARLRAQERHWCADLHLLLGRLREEGFELQVQLERESPEASIPVVVVEDVEEWIEEEAVHDTALRRSLT